MPKRKFSNEDIIVMARMMIDENKTCTEIAPRCGIGKSAVNRYINGWLPNIDTELYLQAKLLMIRHHRWMSECKKTIKIAEIERRLMAYREAHRGILVNGY